MFSGICLNRQNRQISVTVVKAQGVQNWTGISFIAESADM